MHFHVQFRLEKLNKFVSSVSYSSNTFKLIMKSLVVVIVNFEDSKFSLLVLRKRHPYRYNLNVMFTAFDPYVDVT